MSYLEENNIDGYIADHGFRARDPRFADVDQHRPEPAKKAAITKRFAAADFTTDIEQQTCVCPAGKSLWLKCSRAKIRDGIFMQFMGHKEDCDNCPLRSQCLRSAKQKGARQVNVKLEHVETKKNGCLERMKRKIDSKIGRHIYSQRLGIVEPVFGHMCEAMGIKRFTVRSKSKVDGQWKLMTMLHNLTKIYRFGVIG